MESSKRIWDVIVVGGRCAGAATALRFARSGRSVLMLDRVNAASFTLSTHLLVPWALARLRALGVLEEVQASGAPPIHTFVAEFDGKSVPIPMRGPTGYAMCVRRVILDPIMVRAAAAAGVAVRDDATVVDLLWEAGRVCGVVVRDQDGVHPEFARVVIGADGRRSTIARLVKAPEYNVLPSPTGVCFGYFSGIGESAAGANALQFASGNDCEVLCSPCDGGLHIVLLILGHDEFIRVNNSGSDAYLDKLLTIPTFAPRLSAARQVGKLFRASPNELRGFYRVPFGPGWALVGDAGYHAHPAPANGIADALRGAELLHKLIEKAWALGKPAEAFLAEYRNTRDAENAGPYAYSYALGKTNPFRDPDVSGFIIGLSQMGDTKNTYSMAGSVP